MQQLYGAAAGGSQRLFFFSASGYSDQAIQYADQVGILLMTYDPLGEVDGVNQAAKRFLADVSVSPAAVEAPTDWKLVCALTAILIVVLSVTILLWWP
ncbi:hypothetical protein RhoFasB10_03252 [Rhodococcus sp. B10]|nr:hypothetical protein [Rhodococcus sp. B10]